ncbi:MAG: ABC transporter ATP-binding protein [Lachnospiraceae bacterium]|nr:ABC transporter ATP-binding protein [Lachnospiraceae bacterium]
MSENAIEISHLTKTYKLYKKPSDRLKEALGLSRKKRYTELNALDDVSFSVRKGETVGIIGTNGSGKSTILKIITGVLSETSGEVKVDGRISALLELGAGFNMEYTGIENVYLNGTMIGFTREEIDAKLADILDFADIGDFVNQPCKTYSSGMFVRLAFAVAINIDPEILIVDEALSVGDVFFQAKCYHKFDEFKRQGKTILFVSHDLGSVSKYCDRVVLLNKGVKMAEGSPKEMVDLYKRLLVHLESGEEEVKEEETADSGVKQPLTGPLPMNPHTLEYGEGQAEIIQVVTMDDSGQITNALEKFRPFAIRMRVRFLADVESPIYAFTVKNLQGTELTGTNTMFEKIDTENRRAGDVTEVTFRQNLNLQGGEYLLSFGCTGYQAGDFHVFHRLYDVLNFTCISTKNTVGFYDMDSEIGVRTISHR